MANLHSAKLIEGILFSVFFFLILTDNRWNTLQTSLRVNLYELLKLQMFWLSIWELFRPVR